MYIYKHQNLDKNEIYRFLDTLSLNFKDRIEQCIFEYTSMVTGGIRVNFYDVTTLYFEASSEYDLRKVGFITLLTNNLKSQLAYCTFGCLKKLATF